MAPVLTAAVSNTAANGWETKQARTVVRRLARGLSLQTRRTLLDELLRRLGRERTRRQDQKLNHWEVYATARIPELAREILKERRERIGSHIRLNRRTMETIAWRITRDESLADNAISRTCESLWTGKTKPEFSNRALKMDARNELARRHRERNRYESLDIQAAQPASSFDLFEDSESQSEPQDFPSSRAEDQDPLHVLIEREEQPGFDQEVQKAFRDPKWRDVKRRDWAEPLLPFARN